MKRAHAPGILTAATILFFAMTPAMATTVVQSGNTATEIDGLVILGNVYDVTFGTTIDTTFTAGSNAQAAVQAIVSALNTDSTATAAGFGGDFNFVVCTSSSGPGSCDGEVGQDGPPATIGGWVVQGSATGLAVNVDRSAADFALQRAPEPGALIISGSGFALILLGAWRRRGVRR